MLDVLERIIIYKIGNTRVKSVYPCAGLEKWVTKVGYWRVVWGIEMASYW